MKRKKKLGQRVGELDEYLKACRLASRIVELEKNGGRWVAKDRPHKNKKAYDRKRDRKIEVPFNLGTIYLLPIQIISVKKSKFHRHLSRNNKK